MKASKHKRTKRTLDYYRQLYELTEPYRVLVDGSFAFSALKHRIHVKEQLQQLLGGSTHAYVTSCILNELRDMGEDTSGASVILKRYQRLSCNHAESDKGPNARRCILSAISKNNQQKLFVATQDQTLIGWLRKTGDVPIIKLNNNVVFLEHPTKGSKEYKAMIEKGKLLPQEWEKKFLPVMSEASTSSSMAKGKRKRVKNPNPLSCLKPKNRANKSCEEAKRGNEELETPRRKRKRRNKAEASTRERVTSATEIDM
ncbi:hypothetical protein BgAZ_108090 [Babesia gibsoni]|uniref:UTP23 sensor motif region domain-containing protein n=1 Tax=Babesia gibsoni TaxID=33632 RepID=A0AAD8PGM5_BABGI|nr:hypothetical protein BgAZ_108090 [Babesia gibsoni]